MSNNVRFQLFDTKKYYFYKFWKKLQDPIIRPAVAYLAQINVKPDQLSYLNFLMVIPFILVFGYLANPWLAFIFILLGIFFDLLDGSLARHLKIDTERGAFLDAGCDYASFFIVVLTFLYYGVFNSFWGSFYLLNYSILLFLVIIAGLKQVQLFTIIRSKFLFFFVYFVWILTGLSFFDHFMVLFGVYMAVTNYFIFDRIKCSLR